jgi:hypothetical protein
MEQEEKSPADYILKEKRMYIKERENKWKRKKEKGNRKQMRPAL